MKAMEIHPVGTARSGEGGFALELDPAYRDALAGLEGFSHVAVLWWFSEADMPEARRELQYPSPYVGAPEVMGIFATRGPMRPNPIALSVCQVLGVDHETGRVELAYSDAHDGSPVLDIKPYTPSMDRVEYPAVPDWCANWPKSLETSEDFDWESVFAY